MFKLGSAEGHAWMRSCVVLVEWLQAQLDPSAQTMSLEVSSFKLSLCFFPSPSPRVCDLQLVSLAAAPFMSVFSQQGEVLICPVWVQDLSPAPATKAQAVWSSDRLDPRHLLDRGGMGRGQPAPARVRD